MTTTLPRSEVSPLESRVLDCFASGSYALPALLRLVSITESEETETAAVECKDEPRLLVNTKFVEKWAASPEKLFMLIMHELHHILLGHTRLFTLGSPVDNFVFDAIINALLCRTFPQRQFTGFLTDLYPDAEYPACLLRPPARWKPDGRWTLPPALRRPGCKAAAAVYRQLYSDSGATYSDLYDLLRKKLRPEQAEDVRLLGSHSEQGEQPGTVGGQSPMVAEAVKQVVRGGAKPWRGAGGGIS